MEPQATAKNAFTGNKHLQQPRSTRFKTQFYMLPGRFIYFSIIYEDSEPGASAYRNPQTTHPSVSRPSHDCRGLRNNHRRLRQN